MSGFAGMISLEGATPDRRVLERMAQRLAFRGPDGTHITVQPGAGFCFTFLRTGPAPQCPSQPCSLEGRAWLLGDVRLDGRDDLRRKLEQSGEELTADATDEELVLRTWRLWGEEGIAELIGDYAFALWDAEERRLRCWRDLMGARPFFYAQAEGWLYFSNTLDAVRRVGGLSNELDHHFIGDFLLQDYCGYAGRTAFRDVCRLPPGHRLQWSKIGLNVRRCASLPIEEPLSLKREEEYVEQFRGLLQRAVRDRLPSSAAVFMSGGLDSTSVAAIAVATSKNKSFQRNLRAFTTDGQPLFDDEEGLLASFAAEYLGIPIKVLTSEGTLPYGSQADQAYAPEPLHDPFRSLFLKQVREASKDTRVVLNGYGGDGTMTGQTWPYLVYLSRRLQFGALASTFGTYLLKNRRIPPLRGGFRSKLRRCFRRNTLFAEYPSWLSPQLESELNLKERWQVLRRRNNSSHPWHPGAYEPLNDGSWAGTLENEDAAWHGTPLEARAPMLDQRVQCFLLRIPPVPLCINKELLRRSVDGLLPDRIRLRPKTPLVCDLLMLQVQSGRWSPLPLPKPSLQLGALLDWPKVEESLRKDTSSALWRNLRPVSLLYWIADIEKGYSIQ